MSVTPKILRLEKLISAAHSSVFDYLLKVNEESGLRTELRVAGGWVRDALLDRHSNDIDIAIGSSNDASVSGEQFARAVAALQERNGDRARTVSVIRANPALSKHIETATVCVQDIPVEFCALRTDMYTMDSRIPQVRSATPYEDALRRDFTINALFYNLHTRCIEDYTTGLADLESRVIRCPLDPRQTFSDDPLRLLRGVRFVGQLGNLNFSLDTTITDCVDDQLLCVLQRKVSRERVGKEVVKMTTCEEPQKCIDILFSTSLLQSIILVEVHMKSIPGRKQASAEVDRVERLVDSSPDHGNALKQLQMLNSCVTPQLGAMIGPDDDARLAGVLFELVIPFFRGVAAPAVEPRLHALCINGLKLSMATFQTVRRMVDCYNALLRQQVTVAECAAGALGDETKMKVFTALEVMNDSHVFASAFQVVLLTYVALEGATGATDSDEVGRQFSCVWATMSRYPELLYAYILQLPVKGNELRSEAAIPAKEIGSVLLDIRRALVLNPQLTRDDIMAWLKQRGA